jgi:hypothetical protein
VDPGFAEIGELRADVEVPLAQGAGRLEGTLVWQSDGRWVLAERIYYGTTLGSEVVRRSRLNPGVLSAEYGSLVRQLNDTPGLRLTGEVPEGGPGSCGTESKVTFTMVDSFRGISRRWTRCASGDLFTLSATAAGGGAEAPRVVTAAQLTRSFTLGDRQSSVFAGSVPFATLDQGTDSPAREAASRAFYSPEGTVPEDFLLFWTAHAGANAPLPSVDWTREMVLLATGGLRTEAGHEVELRRVLPVGIFTQIQWVERVPGDFCAPAALDRYPYHLVRAPLGPLPVVFGEAITLRIPCGG